MITAMGIVLILALIIVFDTFAFWLLGPMPDDGHY